MKTQQVMDDGQSDSSYLARPCVHYQRRRPEETTLYRLVHVYRLRFIVTPHESVTLFKTLPHFRCPLYYAFD
jgi:hypothetical protein